MSWGTKIIFLYSGFVCLIMTMVFMTMRERVDLVSADYYQQELAYQEKIDRMKRTLELEEPLTWTVNADALSIRFPSCFGDSVISGSICFFRPSDAKLDQTVRLPRPIKGNCSIPLRSLKKGLYKMQVSWVANGIEYYNEGVLQIP